MLSTSHNLLHLITGTQLAKYYVFDLLTAIEQLNLSCTLQDFVLRLKKQGRDDSSDPWREELNTHRIRANRLYLHMVMHMNYRSYNIRRQDDSVNARNHHYVMMLNSPNGGHPYLYARVVSIFHVNAYFVKVPDEEPRLFQVLWILWLDYNASVSGGGFAVRGVHIGSSLLTSVMSHSHSSTRQDPSWSRSHPCLSSSTCQQWSSRIHNYTE